MAFVTNKGIGGTPVYRATDFLSMVVDQLKEASGRQIARAEIQKSTWGNGKKTSKGG